MILDLYSRMVIGWGISKKIDRHLTLSALDMAIKRRNPKIGVIHHSDRGSQYLCEEYTDKLRDHGFHISCSKKGDPYDNAWTESYMKTLKYDEIYMFNYETYLDVVENTPEFIEEVYNKKRPHSALNYLTPKEFENKIKVEYEDNNRVGPTMKL